MLRRILMLAALLLCAGILRADDAEDIGPLPVMSPQVLAQIVVITPATVIDFQGLANSPGNPPAGKGRVYFNSSTSQLTCITSTGASCSGGASSPVSGGSVIDVTQAPYNVQVGFRVFDAKFTNGSSTITLNGEALFNAATMNGWSCFGTTTSGGGANHIGALVAMPEGTITVTGTNTATSTATANASAANTFSQTLVCGPIEDTQLSAAETAAWGTQGSCKTLLLPAGIVLVHSGHFQTIACIGGMFNTNEPAATVMGWGYKTSLIVPTPNFSFTTCTGGAGSNICFGGSAGVHYTMFAIWGGENGNPGNPASTKYALGLAGDNQLTNAWVVGWGASASMTNFRGLLVGTIGQYPLIGGVDGAGSVACEVSGLYVQFTGMFCGDVGGDVLLIDGGAQLRDFGSAYGVPGNNGSDIRNAGGIYYGDGISCILQTSNNGVCYRGDGGTGYLTFVTVQQQNPAQGVWVNGGNVFLANSAMGGNTNPVLVSSGQFFDLGGNSYSGTGANSFTTGTYAADGHSLKGSCTGTVTAASTLGLFGTGPNVSLTTCTSTTIGSGVPTPGARTVMNLAVLAGTGGVNASSGVVTVLKNGVATTITCTLGTGTKCTDGTHQVAFADGDLISISFTTQTADTLANVRAMVEWQ